MTLSEQKRRPDSAPMPHGVLSMDSSLVKTETVRTPPQQDFNEV